MSLASQGVGRRTRLRTQVSKLQAEMCPAPFVQETPSQSLYQPGAAACQILEWEWWGKGAWAFSPVAHLKPSTSEWKALELGNLRFQSQLCHLLSV